jgi:hypothetical protein
VNRAPSRRAFIHIGPHKTGTTAIQSAFGAARDALRHVGYYYLALLWQFRLAGVDEEFLTVRASPRWRPCE